MRCRLNIVIDNTFPKSLAKDLDTFWRAQFPDWTVRHENEVARASTRDSHWIPRLREMAEGDWIIITADRGRGDKKQAEKLPAICKKHRHSYVVVSGKLASSAEFKAAISSIWPQLPRSGARVRSFGPLPFCARHSWKAVEQEGPGLFWLTGRKQAAVRLDR